MAAVTGLVRVLLLILVWRGAVFSTTNELRFLIIGDWGGNERTPYTTPVETAVSREMGKLAEKEGTRFTVALGDNFYHHGVKNVDDKRFKETFEDVFTANSLMTPWYVCAGNHDHSGNVSAQIDYSFRSSRWEFPSYYYTKSWKVPGSDKELQLILLDTVILCGHPGLDKYHLQPEGPESIKQAEDQWQWVESILRSSMAHYLVVGGHFPVWSIAEHGPTWCLVKRLRPLLQRYNVTAYISGHDHNLQHLKEDNSSVEYFVVGAGAYVEYSTKHKNDVPEGSSRFFWADLSHEGGFAVVRTGVDEMTLGFVDSYGNTIYSRKLFPRT